MSLATLPTTRDEAWRYADIAALAGLDPDTLQSWTTLAVAAGATHRQSLLLTGGEPEVQRLRIALAEGARAEIFAVVASADYARLEVEVTLAPGAHFEFGGVTIGGGPKTGGPKTGGPVREIVTRTIHAQPDATSNQIVRAVHWGSASGNFLGRVDVARHAQRTDAAQDFKALLLEKGAAANARPELEIFADDVKCAHGAAIGQMDEAARFYMASRGIAPDAARALLIRAFIADALAALEDEADRERLFQAALNALEERS